MIVVGRAADFPERIVELLSEAGVNVLGPVDNASRALAIAAQTPADYAFIHPKLAGKRDGFELARRLTDTWGVRAVMLPAA